MKCWKRFKGGYCKFLDHELDLLSCQKFCMPDRKAFKVALRKRLAIAEQQFTQKNPTIAPSLVRKAAYFASAVGRRTKRKLNGQPTLVSKRERKSRWSTCQSCMQLSASGNCNACGCRMEEKVKWASEWCVLGKWDVPDLVSVIIPHRNELRGNLKRTVKSIKKTAYGPIEIIQENDRNGEGCRVTRNRAAARAHGRYLFFVDSHCAMSDGWDVKLKDACGEKDIVVSTLTEVDEDSWTPGLKHHRKCTLTPELIERWADTDLKDGPVAETMAFTGCGWMIHQKRFWGLGGYLTTLGSYGGEGPEWSLKIWLSGGRVLIHYEVICGHVWNTNKDNKCYEIKAEEVDKTYALIRKMTIDERWLKQDRSVIWLAKRFECPDWDGCIIMKQRTQMVEQLHRLDGDSEVILGTEIYSFPTLETEVYYSDQGVQNNA